MNNKTKKVLDELAALIFTFCVGFWILWEIARFVERTNK